MRQRTWFLQILTRHLRGTFDIALFNVPASLKPYGYSVASCLLEPRLQAAMKYVEAVSFAIGDTNIQARLPQPPAIYSRLFITIVEVRKFALRNLFLLFARQVVYSARWTDWSSPFLPIQRSSMVYKTYVRCKMGSKGFAAPTYPWHRAC
jgi:hypothetical protein